LKVLKRFLFIFTVATMVPTWLFAVVVEEAFDTHLRWNVTTGKEAVQIRKSEGVVEINTLDAELFNTIKKDLSPIAANLSASKYFKGITFSGLNETNPYASIKVSLASNDVELFNFYRDREGKHVLDFWIQKDAITTTKAAISKKIEEAPATEPVTSDEAIKISEVAKPVVAKKVETPKVIKQVKNVEKKHTEESAFRDFRYGAAFFWDYPSIIPDFKNLIDLTRKTPELFYPVSDREYKKNEQESHMQTTINLYKAKKWGLMNKSIKLYLQKYGEDADFDTNEYLKANALIREQFTKGETAPLKIAFNMLERILEKSKNYDLQKAIYKYLINYYVAEKHFVKGLDLAKRFYVTSKEQFDIEESSVAAEVILHCIASLNQTEILEKVVAEKTIQKLVSSQNIYAYKSHTLLANNRTEQLIKEYRENKKSLGTDPHPAVIFNVAEAFFREGQYKEAREMFEMFVTKFSWHGHAEHARLRTAQLSELMGDDPEKTVALYEDAINRTQTFEMQYEAKLRYVALHTVRRTHPSAKELETRYFLELPKDKGIENADLRKLLWLVRLRTLIVDHKFEDALAYITALPLDTMNSVEKRVFEGDATEVIYGLIMEKYQHAQFANVVELWDIYKDRFVDKVAADPAFGYVVAKSCLELGMFEGFEKVYATFVNAKSAPVKSYPIWLERTVTGSVDEIVAELYIVKNLKLKNWNEAKKALADLVKAKPDNANIGLFEGIIKYNDGDFKKAAASFEEFLSNSDSTKLTSDNEVAQIVNMYIESVFSTNDLEKFMKVSDALLKDTDVVNNNNLMMSKIREKMCYYRVELLFSSNRSESIQNEVNSFRVKYAKSEYSGRMNYILGVTLFRNDQLGEAEKLFKAIIDASESADYLKELARTEISLIRIKQKQI